MAERRKRAGHLLSKHRFLAAQFVAILADKRWLTLARHANLMADKLSAKLGAAGLPPVWPVEANLVFVVLRRALDARLKAAGARYYGRTITGLRLGPDQILARLVTSFATQEDEIDRFAHLCQDF
jgi:threonine aldolase